MSVIGFSKSVTEAASSTEFLEFVGCFLTISHKTSNRISISLQVQLFWTVIAAKG